VLLDHDRPGCRVLPPECGEEGDRLGVRLVPEEVAVYLAAYGGAGADAPSAWLGGGDASARQGVTAMDTGKVPTVIGLPATLVAVAIGVTVFDEPLTT